MDKSLIERLAREAGAMEAEDARAVLDCFPGFAALVASECAKVAEAYGVEQMQRGCSDDHAMYSAAMDIEWAIRAKFRSTP